MKVYGRRVLVSANYASMGMWSDSLRRVPAYRILSCRDSRGWTMPRGRPQASRLRKMGSSLRDLGVAGLASAWAMARRRPNEYRRTVDAATRCSGACPHTWPNLPNGNDQYVFYWMIFCPFECKTERSRSQYGDRLHGYQQYWDARHW